MRARALLCAIFERGCALRRAFVQMSASVRAESKILDDFHFSEGGDLEFCSTFLRFQKVSARRAVCLLRGCVKR